MNTKILRMKELIEKINKAADAYYKYNEEIMSNKEYDELMDELEFLEKESRIVMANSPLHKVMGDVIPELEKIKHDTKMLSADKTKDMNVIGEFIKKHGKYNIVESWKLDGLTIVVKYKNGKFVQAVTRGGGEVGEDVTHTIKHCINLPLEIPAPFDLTVRGECVISYDNFEKINEKLEVKYKNPRNLASGSVRQLDSNIAKERYLEFIAFELLEYDGVNMNVGYSFEFLKSNGFDVVPYKYVTIDNYIEIDERYFNPNNYNIPVDGTIYKIDDYEYGKSLGSTSHHPLNILARKWEDEVYETVILDVDWTMGKTGTLTPTLIFQEVEIDGTIVGRANAHNVTYLIDKDLRVGDTITVYKANMIIPQCDKNLSAENRGIEQSNFDPWTKYNIPCVCPVCGGETVLSNSNNTLNLVCSNPSCSGKLLGRLTSFVSKKGMDIDGLSEATLETFIKRGWLNNLSDIYRLNSKANIIQKLNGFGKKSCDKLMKAIEDSKEVYLDKFICALSIPGIGSSQSKAIAEEFEYDWNKFKEACDVFDFTLLEGFGETYNKNIHDWKNKEYISDKVEEIASQMAFKVPAKKLNTLAGKTFCITGSLDVYSNRIALKNDIESLGGKVVGSVSKTTSYLINNDNTSASSKNTKAKQLGVKIITEKEFINLFK